MISQLNFKNNVYGNGELDITSVHHTNTYAPGIATYSVRGLEGKLGLNGNSIFFTDMIFTNNIITICSRIASKKSVIGWKDYTYNRPYQNGDIFIDRYGNIYLLIDINKVIIDNRNNSTDVSTYLTYFENMGVINNETDTSTLTDISNIRSNKLIITNTDDTNIKSDSLLTLISKSTNNITDFIDLAAIYNGIPDINLSVYFDGNTNSFHIDSSYPICIDAPVSVKYDKNIKTDEYSPILIQENSITTFMSYCNDINVNIDASIFDYKDSSMILYGAIYTITFTSKNTDDDIFAKLSNIDTDMENIMIHFLNGNYQDFQCMRNDVNIYQFCRKYGYVKEYDAINNIYYNELKNILISLIYNIEVFIKIALTNMSGIDFGTFNN